MKTNENLIDQSTNQLMLTIRLIRSFEHRNVKNIVLKIDDKNILVKDLKLLINSEIKNGSKHNIPPPLRTFNYDTLKIEHVPFKSKSTDPIINCENDDDLILKDESSVNELVNETEISYFLLKDYIHYKENKQKLK
jgi:hypothetical protein